MTNKTIQRITRWFLTLLLLRGVYFETGIFTAVSIGLIFISIELIGYIVAKWTNAIMDAILSARDPK